MVDSPTYARFLAYAMYLETCANEQATPMSFAQWWDLYVSVVYPRWVPAAYRTIYLDVEQAAR